MPGAAGENGDAGCIGGPGGELTPKPPRSVPMLGARGGAKYDVVNGGPSGGCGALPVGGKRGAPGMAPEAKDGGPLLINPPVALGGGKTCPEAKGEGLGIGCAPSPIGGGATEPLRKPDDCEIPEGNGPEPGGT